MCKHKANKQGSANTVRPAGMLFVHAQFSYQKNVQIFFIELCKVVWKIHRNTYNYYAISMFIVLPKC